MHCLEKIPNGPKGPKLLVASGRMIHSLHCGGNNHLGFTTLATTIGNRDSGRKSSAKEPGGLRLCQGTWNSGISPQKDSPLFQFICTTFIITFIGLPPSNGSHKQLYGSHCDIWQLMRRVQYSKGPKGGALEAVARTGGSNFSAALTKVTRISLAADLSTAKALHWAITAWGWTLLSSFRRRSSTREPAPSKLGQLLVWASGAPYQHPRDSEDRPHGQAR